MADVGGRGCPGRQSHASRAWAWPRRRPDRYGRRPRLLHRSSRDSHPQGGSGAGRSVGRAGPTGVGVECGASAAVGRGGRRGRRVWRRCGGGASRFGGRRPERPWGSRSGGRRVWRWGAVTVRRPGTAVGIAAGCGGLVGRRVRWSGAAAERHGWVRRRVAVCRGRGRGRGPGGGGGDGVAFGVATGGGAAAGCEGRRACGAGRSRIGRELLVGGCGRRGDVR